MLRYGFNGSNAFTDKNAWSLGRLVLNGNNISSKKMKTVCDLTRRASALALLCTRSTLMEIPKHRVPRSAFEALNACFRRHDPAYFTSKEQTHYSMPYEWESLGALLFSLGRYDLPLGAITIFEPIQMRDLYRATKITPQDPDSLERFYTSVTTARQKEDVWYLRRVHYAWLWRCMIYRLQGMQDMPRPREEPLPHSVKSLLQNLDKAIQAATERCLAEGLIDHSFGNDFSSADNIQPVRTWEPKLIQEIETRCVARLMALDWSLSPTLKLEEAWDLSRYDGHEALSEGVRVIWHQ